MQPCKKNQGSYCQHFNKPNPPERVCAKCEFYEALELPDECERNKFDEDYCLFILPFGGAYRHEWLDRHKCGGSCRWIKVS